MNEVRAHGLTQGDIDDRRERFDNNLERVMRSDFGVNNPLVFEAFRQVDRRAFAPVGLKALAYYDKIIPLNEDASSTISQPSLVGMMIDLLEPTGSGRVLEIGTASGYNAALLSTCFDEVESVEHDRVLAESASHTLSINGYNNINVHIGDGAEGVPESDGYDGIIVTAGARSVPQPLYEQLNIGGRMVIPVGQSPFDQKLLVVRKDEEGNPEVRDSAWVKFVPLMSENGGWTNSEISKSSRASEFIDYTLQGLRPYISSQDQLAILSNLAENVAKRNFSNKLFPYLNDE